MRDGGPAFPIANATFNADAPDSFEQFKAATSQSQGMSLRDYFAAAALQGLLASPAWEKACMGQPIDEVPFVAAEAVYELADAMLAEREKP